MYQALYRKWRPRTFSEVSGQEHITETLKRQIETGRLSHAYLFVGTRGTGKTSCAKILARAVNCEHPVNGEPCNVCQSCLGIENGSILDVVEMDAASNNGVDNVRALREEAVFTPAAVKKRVYIIDEVHMMSGSAFNALLKILEEPPEHLIFILATTELHKVPATILSRCQRFSFRRLSRDTICKRLLYVAGQESIRLTDGAAALLARLADGSMRDGLSLLDQCVCAGEVDENRVMDVVGLTGAVETAQIFEFIKNGDTPSALGVIDRLYSAGRDMSSLLDELSRLTRDILMVKLAGNGGEGLLSGSFDGALLKTFAGMTTARLFSISETLSGAMAELTRTANRRLTAELCVMRMCDESLNASGGDTALLSRIERLEGMVQLCSKLTGKPSSHHHHRDEERESGEPEAPEEPEPEREPEPEPETPTEPAERSVQTGDVGEVWTAVLAALEARLSMPDYMLLADRAEVIPALSGDTLTLAIPNEVFRNLLGSQEITDAVREAAGAARGRPTALIISADAPEIKPNTDKLNALLKFGNIQEI